MLSPISFEGRLITSLEENFISQGTNCTLFAGQVLTEKNFAFFGEEQLRHRYVTVGSQIITQVTASIP